MKTLTKNIVVLDNNGETFDRYTIINKKTGDMIGSSERPFAPNGFGQHCGNLVDNYMFHAYGYSWRKHCDVKKIIKTEVQRYLSDCSNVGQPIEFNSLHEDVQKFAIQSFQN